MEKKPLNFKKDERKAKAWSQKRYWAWMKELPDYRKNAIEAFKSSSKEINGKLSEVRGNIDKLTDEQLKKQIKEMNRMIKHPVNQLEERQIIYIHFDPIDLGYSDELQMLVGNGDRQFDRGKIKTVLNEYKYGNLTDLKIGNLTLSGGETGQYYVAELELPKGTYLGHLGDGQTVLPTDYAIEITNNMLSRPKVIRENGKELIKVNARLIKKEKIENKVKETEAALNKMLYKDTDFVKLNIGGGFESYTIDQAKEAIHALIKHIPSKLLNDALDELESIVFQDVKIRENNPRGLFDENTNTVYIRVKHETFIQNIDQSADPARGLIHEMGHVADIVLFNKTSYSPRFNGIYEEEKNNITNIVTYQDYAARNAQEFFAEIFKAMHSTDPKQQDAVKKEAPKAVDYINTKIKEYIED
ncbi:ADP-ribosyltransferase [Paenibacillus thiaminolyticus]|uniref:anthrax toxin lethal factor-related metalloendopeptidase n=1 Tax=Paenibacillus thiaminolyticus TaxID=49283 RepID=UPI003D297589